MTKKTTKKTPAPMEPEVRLPNGQLNPEHEAYTRLRSKEQIESQQWPPRR